MKQQSKSHRFLHQEDGIVSVLFVVLLPLLILAAGIAIDLSSIAAQKRYVQGQADLGALTAIRHFDTASEMRAAARKTIFGSGCSSWYLDATGVPVSWPWSYDAFAEQTAAPKNEDYEYIA